MTQPSLRVAIRTLGCKVNRVESDTVAAELLGRGIRMAEAHEAHVVVINTCTVTGEADAKARKAVRQALAEPLRPVVVVTGCLAAIDSDALQALGDRVVVEADKTLVARRVARLLALDEDAHGDAVARSGEDFRTRAMLKVEDGCDNFCSYCIVPYARGVPRGVPLPEAVAEARLLLEAGVQEIVLTGINIGRYRDQDSGVGLPELIRAIASTGVRRLRLSSIEPPDLTDELLAVLAETASFCEHLHVPLQSGSDSVLSRMGRGYTTAQYADAISAARDALPGLAITTDIIAGFPEESPDQHSETLEFVEEVGFSKLHVFRYSVRPGTPAADMTQVPPDVRALRAAELRLLGDRLRERYVAGRIGAEIEILVESVGLAGPVGTTRDYLRVRACREDAAPGTLLRQTLRTDDVVFGQAGAPGR